MSAEKRRREPPVGAVEPALWDHLRNSLSTLLHWAKGKLICRLTLSLYAAQPCTFGMSIVLQCVDSLNVRRPTGLSPTVYRRYRPTAESRLGVQLIEIHQTSAPASHLLDHWPCAMTYQRSGPPERRGAREWQFGLTLAFFAYAP